MPRSKTQMLYLVRHGEAEPEDIDPSRPLTEKGKFNVNKVAAILKEKGVIVSAVFHSTKARAKQTAQIIAGTINHQCKIIQKNYLSPNDDLDPIYGEILSTKTDLIIIGHLPFIPKLVSRLTSGTKNRNGIAFLPGTVAVLEKGRDSDIWKLKEIISP